MLNALKYIVLFLLGYKIIKELFGNKQNKQVRDTTPKETINTETKNKTTNNNFDEAEDIDYEELK
jgi:hypothetical protein